jgi:hypothetical protein
VTLADMVGALQNPAKAELLSRVPGLPAFWRRFATG